jgi:hypothetical protein
MVAKHDYVKILEDIESELWTTIEWEWEYPIDISSHIDEVLFNVMDMELKLRIFDKITEYKL